MPNSKKILYGMEQYMEDRKGGTAAGSSATVLPAPTAAAAPTQTAAPAPTQAPSTQIAPASARAQTETTTPVQAPSMQMGTGEAGAVSPTQPMSLSDMWKMELSNARNKVYEVMNQKFTYNEKSSPLYSILQKQYEREADRAAGQAYARSVANTGGYGSSYATLAADEARRRTMEGFDDQQLALYQAAKDEFYANRQSAIDWYNQAKQIYGDAVNEDLTNAYDEGISAWLESGDEAAVRELLEGTGKYNATTINNAITMMKEYSADQGALDATLKDQAYTEAYNTGSSLATTLAGQGKTEEEIEAELIAQGIDPAAVEQIMSDRLEQKASDAANQEILNEIEKNTRTDAEAEEAKNAYNSWLDDWLANPDETAIRAAMQAAGISEAAINAAIVGFMEYSAVKADFDKTVGTGSAAGGGLTDEEKGDLLGTAQGVYDKTNKGQVEEQLKQSGATQEEADEIIGKLEETERAGLDDSAAQVSDIKSAIDHKAELDASLKNTTLSVEAYDQYVAENSAKVMKEITPNLDDMSEIDYEALGIPKAEWEAMDDADKKLTVFASVGELAKEGIVTHADYERMLTEDTRELFASEEYAKSKRKTRDAVDRAIVIQDLYESGYLLEDEYVRLLYVEIAPKIEKDKTFKEFVRYAPQYEIYGSDLKEAVRSFDGQRIVPDIGLYSDEEQEMMMIMARFIAKKDEDTRVSPEVIAAVKEQNKTPTQKKMTESRANARER